MFLRSTFAVAGLAALSSAFLVPSPVLPAETDIVKALPFELLATSDGAVEQLDCPGCPVLLGSDNAGIDLWGVGPAFKNKIELDIQINHLKEADVLTVNGIQVFPISGLFNIEPLTATQIHENAKGTAGRAVVPLGHTTAIHLVRGPTEEENLALYRIRIQVVEVGNRYVDGVEAVELNVIATPAGGLMITNISKMPSTIASMPADAECQTTICRLRATLAAHVAKLQEKKPKQKGGCHGKGKGRGKFAGLLGKPAHKGQHGQHKGEHAHGSKPHHHRHHRFGKLFHNMKSAAFQVLIPVFVGIAAGMTASFVGMVVGHFIVLVWRTFFRRGAKGACTQSRNQVDVKNGFADEKHFILVEEEDEEPLPAYKDEVDEKAAAV